MCEGDFAKGDRPGNLNSSSGSADTQQSSSLRKVVQTCSYCLLKIELKFIFYWFLRVPRTLTSNFSLIYAILSQNQR
jgi:hypothetical protein